MVRLSKKTRDRSVSPRRPKSLLIKSKIADKENEKKQNKAFAFKEHENAVGAESSPLIFIPRIK